MTVGKAEICNLALSHLKQAKSQIANFDTDKGHIADLCRTHYDVARRFVLVDHEWNFATRRVALGDIGNPPAIWAYRYDYPSNALKIREIERASKDDPPIPFVVEEEDDGSGLCILTDKVNAVAVYTVNVENTALFSPGYVSTLAWYLASEMAPGISGKESLQEACLTVYRNTGAAAQAIDSSEGEADEELDSPWERARIGGRD